MTTENRIGIISEGVTDQAVLESILMGWTGDRDLPITRLQPKENEAGNWDKVFKYCQSDEFKGAFAFCETLIIQIDTDFMLRGEVPPNVKIDIQNLSVEETIEAFKQKMIKLIGEEFYKDYQQQIIFAIAVHEIECWLLPIYYATKKAGKIVNCLDTLNKVLPQKEGFYLNEKRFDFYEKMAKPFRKKKNIKKYAPENPSFDVFIKELEHKIA